MILNPDLEPYIHNLLPARPPVLMEMETYAAEHDVPIVGPAVGGLLALMVKISGARRIFELGSAIGYSTYWLADAAGPGAEVHYSDGSAENTARARAWLQRAGLASRITFHTGDALQALAATSGLYDLIFNDVDKEGYPDVLRAVPVRLKPGGLLLTDNTLWSARVLKPEDSSDHGVVAFNRALFAHPDFETTLVPLRDGVTVSRKRSHGVGLSAAR